MRKGMAANEKQLAITINNYNVFAHFLLAHGRS